MESMVKMQPGSQCVNPKHCDNPVRNLPNPETQASFPSEQILQQG